MDSIYNVKSEKNSQSFLLGKILEEKNDSLTIETLTYMMPDYVSPTHFDFELKNIKKINILSSNINSNRYPTHENVVIKNDSLMVGVFALYSPDYFVKNDVNPEFGLSPKYLNSFKKHVKKIKKNYPDIIIIVLSNLSKAVDRYFYNNIPVEAIVSFDYKNYSNTEFGEKQFYSLKSDEIGVLLINRISRNELEISWEEKVIK